MAWKCADCNEPENRERNFYVDAVCHHCGKPLCRNHRIAVKDDEAFSPRPADGNFPGSGPYGEDLSRMAFHCKECKERHHLRAATAEGRAA